MTEEEAEIHGRIAAVGRFVIDEREASGVGEQVLGAEVAVTETVGDGQHLLDDRFDGRRHLGPVLLNAAVERIDAQWHEHGAIGEGGNQGRIGPRVRDG